MSTFDEKYPFIAAWVQDGTIEVGNNDWDNVFLRATDPGGVVWESAQPYENLDDAFFDLNAGIEKWCRENGIDFGI